MKQQETLRFEKVTGQNRQQAEQLQVAEHQNGFIETVQQCLQEADELSLWQSVVIYEKDEMIGFAMYGYFDMLADGELWLDHFMIDQKAQHRGYGKRAVLALLEQFKKEFKTDKVYLSVYDENTTAIHLYQELGFHFNGKLDLNGEKVMERLLYD